MGTTEVPGLERGVALLRLFRRGRTRVSAPEVTAELRIPRSTVHRLLHSLEALGLLRGEPDGRFALGPGVLSLGFEYLATLDVAEVANPVLAWLRDEIGCSAHLAVLDRTNVVFVARLPARGAVVSSFGVGFTVPAHLTRVGRLMLGDLSADALAALYRGARLVPDGRNAPRTLAELAGRIAEDRARGFGISDSASAGARFPRGMIAISAPVRGAGGRIVAAVNATTVSGAFPAAEIEGRLKDRVVTAANEISSRLGAPREGRGYSPPALPPPAPRRRARRR